MNDQKGNAISYLVIMVLFIMIIVTIVSYIPTMMDNSDQVCSLDEAIRVFLSNGYTAYADPSGDIHVNNVIPNADSTYDIGELGNEFANGYFDNIAGGSLVFVKIDGTAGTIATLASTTVTISGTLEAHTGRSSTIVIAASDASDQWKEQSDIIVEGTAEDEIQDAYDFLDTIGGGSIELSDGIFTIPDEERIIPVSNTILEGQGIDITFLQRAAGSGTDSAWALIGVISGDSVNPENVTIRDLTVDGNGEVGIQSDLIVNYRFGYNWLIQDVKTEDAGRDGISMQKGVNHQILNCFTLNNTSAGVHFGSGCRVSSCSNLYSQGDEYGFVFCVNLVGCKLSDSIIIESEKAGVRILNNDVGISIDNVTFRDCPIGIESTSSGCNWTVSNCTFIDCEEYGIEADEPTGNVTNCKFIETGTDDWTGIYAYNNYSGNITNNYFNLTATGTSISIGAGVTGVNIANNDIVSGIFDISSNELMNNTVFYLSNDNKVGLGTITPTTELDINGEFSINSSVGEIPLTITVGGTTVATIWPEGHFQNADGIRTVSAKFGPSFLSHNKGEGEPEHTNGVGSYDYTGGTYEALFTATAGDVFTTADAGDGQMNSWILMTGADMGAFGEIETYISPTQVLMAGLEWDEDLASQSFMIYRHPTFVTGAGNRTDISTNSDGEFKVHSREFTGAHVAKIVAKSNADGVTGLLVTNEANGQNLNNVAQFEYVSGNLADGDVGGGVFVTIDDTDDLAQDATTILGGVAVQHTNSGTAVNRSFVSIGADEHFVAIGAAAINPDYGYSVASGVVTNRVTGTGASGQKAFIQSGTNVQVMVADNDYVLYGNDDKFEMVDIVLSVVADASVRETVEYSTGAGTWAILPLQSDTMRGWRQTGGYIWNDPGGAWVEVSQAEAGGDITEGYYLKVTRTRNSLLTVPTEEICDIHLDSSGDTGMKVKANGVVNLPGLTGISDNVENNDIWMESDGLHIYYGGTEYLLAGV